MLLITISLFALLFSVQALPPEKYSISVYYETLCPDSIRFITTQLVPTFNWFGGLDNPVFHIKFEPYGKANTTDHGDGTYSFVCQHGNRECVGNRMHACALNRFAPEFHADFISCSMGSGSPPEAGPECAELLGLDFGPVQECIETDGDALLAEIGERTHALNPPLYYVPWIILDGEFTEDNLWDFQEDFMLTICSKFNHEFNKCKERMPSRHSPASSSANRL